MEPMQTVVGIPKKIPLVGYASLRERDFRCTLEGKDVNGDLVSAIVIVNKNHFHVVDIE